MKNALDNKREQARMAQQDIFKDESWK